MTVGLRSADGTEEEVRTRYLVGCDGAHSLVRKRLGLTFEGSAFPEEYMLADVQVDWDLPEGYGVRATHRDTDGAVDDLLVCIPLPGRGRYRMSMLVPSELSTERQAGSADGVAHGIEGGQAPHSATSRPSWTGCRRADDRFGHALVLGVPYQPSHRGPVR